MCAKVSEHINTGPTKENLLPSVARAQFMGNDLYQGELYVINELIEMSSGSYIKRPKNTMKPLKTPK
jgi:hypothetical protein